ncbi:MAG: bifunctional pyr operon transcriptional regulator/uracil phosphoribosyltransferase PyrR [Verrucomicrobiota bacterium]
MSEAIQLLNADALGRTLARMAHEIIERNPDHSGLVLIGIQRTGVFLAQRLSTALQGILGKSLPVGAVDISMHRDDLDVKAVPTVYPTHIPFDITGKTVVLVDDVLFSGRTIRAALDAMNDFGRPRRVQLAVLIDRGHRDLPIKADFVGKNVPTAATEHIEARLKEDGGDDSVVLLKD